MDYLNVALDRSVPVSLQNQLRQKLIDAIYRGVLKPGDRLPSTRILAQRLGVSRNTVSLVYDALIAEGHLVSRLRSGTFVAAGLPGVRVAAGSARDDRSQPEPASRALPRETDAGFEVPVNWHQYPYAFVDEFSHPELLPVDEWREAMQLACARHELARPESGARSTSNEKLVDQLRSRILTIYGVMAASDEVMATVSARHALHLVMQLLVQRGSPVVLQESLETELRGVLEELGAIVTLLDPEFKQPLPGGVIALTSPHRNPAFEDPDPARLLAAVTQADGIIIERSVPPSMHASSQVPPALKAIDDEGRVVHVSSLSPVVSCDTPLGIITAPAVVTRRLRKLRRRQGTNPSAVIQRAWAYFISLGHYASALARAERVLARRMEALRDALNHYLHLSVEITSLPGRSAYWVRVHDPGGMSSVELALRAARRGILVQPLESHDQRAALVMGVASISEEAIRSGVQSIARLIRGDLAEAPQRLSDEAIPALEGAALQQAMSGTVLVYNTVYGDPCTLEILADGRMRGAAGQADEDSDSGRWWVEEGRWYRQWQRWAYAEAYGFWVVIDGDQLRWYDDQGLLADTAVISRSCAVD